MPNLVDEISQRIPKLQKNTELRTEQLTARCQKSRGWTRNAEDWKKHQENDERIGATKSSDEKQATLCVTYNSATAKHIQLVPLKNSGDTAGLAMGTIHDGCGHYANVSNNRTATAIKDRDDFVWLEEIAGSNRTGTTRYGVSFPFLAMTRRVYIWSPTYVHWL